MGSCPQVPQPGEVQIRAVEPVGGRHSVPERIPWPLVGLSYSGYSAERWPRVAWNGALQQPLIHSLNSAPDSIPSALTTVYKANLEANNGREPALAHLGLITAHLYALLPSDTMRLIAPLPCSPQLVCFLLDSPSGHLQLPGQHPKVSRCHQVLSGQPDSSPLVRVGAKPRTCALLRVVLRQ